MTRSNTYAKVWHGTLKKTPSAYYETHQIIFQKAPGAF